MSQVPMKTIPRKLLVLDLDETLIHARENRLEHAEDFTVGPYFVYRRPHLDVFLQTAVEHFDVAVWTASGEQYAEQVVERLFHPGSLQFVWSSKRCTTVRDWTTGNYTKLKSLSKIKRKGYALESVIAIDDTYANYARSYGNLVMVREFSGDRSDDELLVLASYLKTLLPVTNIRKVEKRNWRKHHLSANSLHGE